MVKWIASFESESDAFRHWMRYTKKLKDSGQVGKLSVKLESDETGYHINLYKAK